MDFLEASMNPYISQLQQDHETTKNKKVKGPQKKQNQKLGVALYKLNNAKKVKEKIDEVIVQI